MFAADWAESCLPLIDWKQYYQNPCCDRISSIDSLDSTTWNTTPYVPLKKNLLTILLSYFQETKGRMESSTFGEGKGVDWLNLTTFLKSHSHIILIWLISKFLVTWSLAAKAWFHEWKCIEHNKSNYTLKLVEWLICRAEVLNYTD